MAVHPIPDLHSQIGSNRGFQPFAAISGEPITRAAGRRCSIEKVTHRRCCAGRAACSINGQCGAIEYYDGGNFS